MRVFILGFLLTIQTLAMAVSVGGEEQRSEVFDIKEANQRFVAITERVTANNMELVELQQAIERLNDLMSKAQNCVDKAGKKIQGIDQQINQYFGDVKTEKKGADLLYLEKQKKKFTERQAQCRLFVIKAKETVEAWRESALAQQQKITFTKGKPIWKRWAQLKEDSKQYRWPDLKSQAQDIKSRWVLLALLALFIPIWLLSRYIAGKFHKSVAPCKRVTRRFSIILYALLWVTAALYYAGRIFAEKDILFLVTSGLQQIALIFLGILLITLIVSFKRVVEFFKWYGLNVRLLYYLIVSIGMLYVLNIMGNALLEVFHAPANTIYFFETVMLLLVLLVMFYFSVRFYVTHQIFFGSWISRRLLSEFFVTITGLLVLADVIGYHQLAMNASNILIAVLVSGLMAVVGWRGIQKIYLLINYSPQSGFYLRRFLGYRAEPPYFEILILKWIMQFILILAVCYLFSILLDEQGYFIDDFLAYFVEGMHLVGYHIIPLQWLIGLLMFCLLILLAHYIAARVSQREQFDEEEEMQVALASIINYAGLAIAVIVGLLIAGFSFTSLAIIAGALSVGIGLGLQSIVNNFFSGLILLIEKPIKAGDRISVNGVEGFVKRVRVRSTHIVTPAKEDIIIPNSDLITQQVTNFMFDDNLWRVKCEVGVAYGSNVQLVAGVLMQVALSHPEVVNNEKDQPMVLFRTFGDSALLFELWCLIVDVNNKYRVGSELNFAIEAAFREHNITIAFPQRDVHVYYPDTKPPGTSV